MNRHPQEYSNIHILYNEIISEINNNNITCIISFSTAGSHAYSIGSIIQFDSVIIEDPKLYDLNNRYIKAKKTYYKTNKYLNKPITDTKGFIIPSQNQIASGQDEFVIYKIGNDLNIPSLTLTGISDNDNKQEYDNGGVNLSAKNMTDYFFEYFVL